MSEPNPWPTVEVFGMPIAAVGPDDLFAEAARAIDGRRAAPLCLTYANAHSCNLFLDDVPFRAALQRADVIYLDGNGPRLAAALAGAALPPRLTGADWIVDLLRQAAARRDRVFLLGSRPEVVAAVAERLRAQTPGLDLAGWHHGYFDEAQAPDVLTAVRAARPQLLLLGMGSPRQELWMAAHAEASGAAVIWCVGAALEYAAGLRRRPPRWMRRLGLEWLGRLLIEPRRLAGRYLIGLPRFALRALAFAWRARRGAPPGGTD